MKTIKWDKLHESMGIFIDFDVINQNHIIMHYKNGHALFSYRTLVAVKQGTELYLTEDHDYSATTNKYVKNFTYMSAKERREGLTNESFTKIIF